VYCSELRPNYLNAQISRLFIALKRLYSISTLKRAKKLIIFQLPKYAELFNLSGDEKRSLMYISQHPEHYEAESVILRSLAYAVETKSSDIHFNAKLLNGKLAVFINIRTPDGFVNHAFKSEFCDPIHFQTKLLQLTNNTAGGTQAEIISTRFSLDFPTWWARDRGLLCDPNEAYKTDIRVQFQKTFSGFSIVCRVLDQQRTPRLCELGFTLALEQLIKKAIHEPSGLILVSGPTGSGKTTLLHAMLCELNDGTRSIFTIENPVEFRLKGNGPITQIQTHGQVSFAAGLRSALRSDPDVILIGEIRDSETMEIALQAAQTGHLVLATIHASSAAQTISRMLDLTIDKEKDSFRVSETLKLVLAQRLIVKYKNHPVVRELNKAEIDWLSANAINIPTLFTETDSHEKLGVTALIEAIKVEHAIKKIIRSPNFTTDDIYQTVKDQLHYESLPMSAFRHIENGGARLSDCMTKLDTLQQSASTPPLRSKLANLYSLSYSNIGVIIDDYLAGQYCSDHSETTSITSSLGSENSETSVALHRDKSEQEASQKIQSEVRAILMDAQSKNMLSLSVSCLNSLESSIYMDGQPGV